MLPCRFFLMTDVLHGRTRCRHPLPQRSLHKKRTGPSEKYPGLPGSPPSGAGKIHGIILPVFLVTMAGTPPRAPVRIHAKKNYRGPSSPWDLKNVLLPLRTSRPPGPDQVVKPSGSGTKEGERAKPVRDQEKGQQPLWRSKIILSR